MEFDNDDEYPRVEGIFHVYTKDPKHFLVDGLRLSSDVFVIFHQDDGVHIIPWSNISQIIYRGV